MFTLDQLVAFAKRRGFVYPSSEIYGGFAAVYDYGPYGVELLNNIKKAWWKAMVQERDDIVGLDSAIFMHPRTWEASGHVGGFADPLAECKSCNTRVRVDKLLGDINVVCDEKMTIEEINAIFDDHRDKIICPKCGKKNFTPAKFFNLLVKTNLGNFTGNFLKDPTYLRGETCQGIYLNYKNVLATTRVKPPFGIAQIGKAFRNEITARQFVFRTREFEQMEMQYFTAPEDSLSAYEQLKTDRWSFWRNVMGFCEQNLRWHQHENLVFYAKAAFDIEYRFPWGFDEMEGIHARSDYDLTQHGKFSGVDMTYTDQTSGAKYVPHIIESSAGVGRTALAVFTEFVKEEKLENGGIRTVFALPYHLAPIKTAVFPLLKNKSELVSKAKELHNRLKKTVMCEFDDNGNVGKRYRRQDEIGTPWCITVDFDTLSDNTVTIRNRDTMIQERINLENVEKILVKDLN